MTLFDSAVKYSLPPAIARPYSCCNGPRSIAAPRSRRVKICGVAEHVLIVGAGPAGTVAATVLARVGVRVRLVDRATFPRDKLCGDTINPGTPAALRDLNLAQGIEDRGLRVDGMLMTGLRGVAIEGRYPGGLTGRALVRRDLDWKLLEHAME